MANKRVSVGAMRHVVTIQLPGGSISPTGGIVEGDPQTIAEHVPMSIQALDVQSYASERIAAGGLQGTTMYTVQCRYRTDFTGQAVLVEECCTQRRLEVLSLAPTDRNEALEMLCVERLQ